MKFSIGAGKYKRAFLASVLFVFALFAGGEFIKASTYDKITKIYGENARKRVVALNELMVNLKTATEQEKLIKVNDFFNRLQWKDDKEVWGKKDYWSTRMEFLGKGSGD